jgi:hypothetical protein
VKRESRLSDRRYTTPLSEAGQPRGVNFISGVATLPAAKKIRMSESGYWRLLQREKACHKTASQETFSQTREKETPR